MLLTLDRLGQRYGLNPVSLIPDGPHGLVEWSLLIAIAQTGCKADREEMEAAKASRNGMVYARKVEGESPLMKRKKTKRLKPAENTNGSGKFNGR